MSALTRPVPRTRAGQARRPAGSPAGGQFSADPRAEAELDLAATGREIRVEDIAHPVAWMAVGAAGPADLTSVVRAGLPDHEDGTAASLTCEEVRQVLARHLPGLDRDDLAAHIEEIERGAARVEEVEASDPDGLDPASLDVDTAYPISLDGVREQYLAESDAVTAWRDELREWWTAYTQAAIHTAWTHSVQRRNRLSATVTR